jgi:tRNA (mo5U34)-methyltransferase
VETLLDGAVPVLPRFETADVYELPRVVPGPFEVTLALGGLYHVADPVLVLRNLRQVTSGHLVLQTSRVLRLAGSWGKFLTVTRAADVTQEGGAGVWKLSRKALETMLRYARFEVVERLPVPRIRGRRIPWYGAICRAT